MRHGKAVLRSALVLLSLTTAGCEQTREMRQGLGEMMDLRSAISDEFDSAPNIGVTSDGVLTVTFLNSGRERLPEAEQQAAARAAAELVRDRYAGYTRLKEVVVVFSSNRKVGPVSMGTNTPHTFSVADLGPAPAAAEPKPAS